MVLTPARAAQILADLQIRETLAQALEQAADRISDALQAELAATPGGPHATPWRQTGELQDSIAITANGLEAAVGSSDPAAIPQELGTTTIPPRPFLAPVGAALAENIARDIGAALARTIARGRA